MSSEVEKAHDKRGLNSESVLYMWLDSEAELLLRAWLRVPSVPLEASGQPVGSWKTFLLMGETIFSSPVSCSDLPFQAKLAERFAAQGNQPLAFGLAEPDLFEIQWTEGRIVWRVIDAKASQDRSQRVSLS
jgi:hypothetical protein